jgi:hypothetical protein
VLGVKLQQLALFAPIRQHVQIPQKTVRYAPADKLYAVLIGCLAGASRMVELNQRLRADPALQAAVGLAGCAEQSVIQETLDACTPDTVEQLEAALTQIYRQHSQGYRHDYRQEWQLLDVDMSGIPCGKKAALATKGYFAHHRYRRGRQLGRVLAARYEEIVVDQLFSGRTQLTGALQPLVEAAEARLDLDAEKRARTIIRVDAGGGSFEQVNWVLARGYQFHGRDYSAWRAEDLSRAVSHWVSDPRFPERQVGWVEVEALDYVAPLRRIVVRGRKTNGAWGYGVLLSSLPPEAVLALTGQPPETIDNAEAVLLAYVYLYDQRSGTMEISLKGDKQGLGITRRNKKRFAAQQVLMGLAVLAHNVLVWAREWLAASEPTVRQ